MTLHDGQAIRFEHGCFTAMGPDTEMPVDGEVINVNGDILRPGYVDLQVNGDPSEATPRQIVNAHRGLHLDALLSAAKSRLQDRQKTSICSTYVLMRVLTSRPYDTWPRPPSCLVASRLDEPPEGARIAVAGLVILRQRPGTAKGVIFLTLEDETGVVNIVVWRKLYERYRRAVIAGRMLRVTGRLQRDSGVVHVIAEEIEDISPMLDSLLAETG